MNIRPIILAISFLILFPRCVSDKNSSTNETNLKKPGVDSITKEFIQKFALPYPEQEDLNSNTLVFYRSSNYDTSLLLQITKCKHLVRGVFYEILPQYHRFITDYADEDSRLIFFEGYGFTIDSTTWEAVSQQAKLVFQNSKGIDSSKGKFTDGSNYRLYFEGKLIHGDSNDDTAFEQFYSFLRIQFLNKYMQLRKPKIFKSK